MAKRAGKENEEASGDRTPPISADYRIQSFVRCGDWTFNIASMITALEIRDGEEGPSIEVTMQPGRTVRLVGPDAEKFRRKLAEVTPEDRGPGGRPSATRSRVIEGSPIPITVSKRQRRG